MLNTTAAQTAPAKRNLLARHAASELLAQELREEILDGRLRPGESLRETELADRYGVARNTVREALRLLTGEGLGTHAVHHGVTVRVFAPDEVRAIFEFRRVLEETAAGRAGTLTPEEIVRLELALRSSEEAFEHGDSRVGLNANLAFHRELVRLVGNQRMDEVFDQILTEVRLILGPMETRSGGPWIERNRSLLQALIEGAPDRFRNELADYIAVSLEEAIGLLEP